MTLREIRNSPGAAWAGPLLIFLAFMLIPELVGSDAAGAPWYLAQPKQWVYPVQTVATLAALVFWWQRYTLKPLGAPQILMAATAGTAGIVLWILPSWLYDHGYSGKFLPSWLCEKGIPGKCYWLGFTSRNGGPDSFDPTIWAETPGLYWSVVAMRFVRMTLAVAFAEELFWRGFLWRMVADPYRDFNKVSFGRWSWQALGAITLLFAFSHGVPDRFAAVIYCLIISGLYVRTKSVGACVIAHAVSNFILGVYVMTTRQWGFW